LIATITAGLGPQIFHSGQGSPDQRLAIPLAMLFGKKPAAAYVYDWWEFWVSFFAAEKRPSGNPEGGRKFPVAN
jgi:hypothetical protein